MMYLARVLQGREPTVFQIDEFEHVLTGRQRRARSFKRAKHAWPMSAPGLVGAAAISDTPNSAIGAAKCMLEAAQIKREEADQRKRNRVIEP